MAQLVIRQVSSRSVTRSLRAVLDVLVQHHPEYVSLA